MTRWSRQAVLVVLVASMVMVAVPAQVGAASGTLVVGSQHSTDSDFQNAQKLTNLTVSGSGESATVKLPSATFSDGFENEPADSGVPEDWTAETLDGSVAVSNSDAYSGSQSMHSNATGTATKNRLTPSEQPYTATTNNISLAIKQSSGDDATIRIFESGTFVAEVGFYQGDLVAYNPDGSRNTLSTAIGYGEWVNITLTNIDPSTDTYDVSWTSASDSGSATNLDLRNSMSDGWTTAKVYTYQSEAYYDDYEVGGGTSQSAKYVSPVHSVSNGEEAAINITQASNVSVEATVRTDGGTVLNQTTLTSTGNHSLTLASTSSEKLETELNVTVTGDNPQFELADESILFTNDAPVVNNSTASPSGGEELSTDDVTLSIDVSDPQFGTAQGDELQVEWYIDGTKVDTTTGITSNGTVSTTISDVDGGDRTWHAVVTDDYGATTTSQTFDFRIPNQLAIRNVSAPSTLITGASVKLTFYSDNDVVTKNDSDNDGFIDLSGLDPSERFIVVVEANNYYKRTVILDDIFTQDSVYLLNKSKAANEVRFTIDDPTGLFSSGEAEIFVKKALTRDFDNDSTKETRVVRIAGDEQGVNGFTTFLEDSARYRIEVRNKDGDTRLLGAYTADTSETVTLQPGSLGLEFDNESTWNSTAYRRNVSGQPELVFEFADPANETTNLKVAIWEQGNKSHQPDNWNNVSLAGPFGSYQATPALTANETDTVWVVNFTADRSGEEITGQFVLGPEIQQQLGGVAPWLLEALAMVAIILTGALFSKANAGVGGVTTALMGGGFWYVGFLSPEAGGGILLFLAIAIAYKFKGDMA